MKREKSFSLTNLRSYSDLLKEKRDQSKKFESIIKNPKKLESSQFGNKKSLSQLNKDQPQIKQIYEYKIKQRAKISKQTQSTNAQIQELSLKLQMVTDQNQQLLRDNQFLKKQNKKLKQLITIPKTKKTQDKKHIDTNNYKKQILDKMKSRNRINTEASAYDKQFVKMQRKSKSKGSEKNNFTMNLNMSFVKIADNTTIRHSKQKQKGKRIKSKGKSQKNSRDNSRAKQIDKEKQDIHQIFENFLKKEEIFIDDLKQFYELNIKVFKQFESLFKHSKTVYSKLAQKINKNQYKSMINKQKQQYEQLDCYLRPKQEKLEFQSQTKYSQILSSIIDVYRYYEPHCYHQTEGRKSSSKKNVSLNSEQSLTSSVDSIKAKFDRKKSLQSSDNFRVSKLNENLLLLNKYENRKDEGEKTQTSTQIKPYISKPVSSQVSRKISFSNSLNNSLGGSKNIQK